MVDIVCERQMASPYFDESVVLVESGSDSCSDVEFIPTGLSQPSVYSGERRESARSPSHGRISRSIDLTGDPDEEVVSSWQHRRPHIGLHPDPSQC